MLNFLKSFSKFNLRGTSAALTAMLALSASQVLAQSPTAEELLSRDLQPKISTLKKTIKVYNYWHLYKTPDQLLTPEGRASYSTKYVQDLVNRYWDLSYTINDQIAAGPGLYLGTDPYIADQQGFGNTVIELEVPAGTKTVNVVEPIPVKADTIRALIKEGYLGQDDVKTLFVSSKSPGFYRDTLKFATQPGFENFRMLVQRVLEANGISFIEYNWRTAVEGFCKTFKYSAFVYIGTRDPLNPGKGVIADAYRNLPMASRMVWPDLTVEEQNFFDRIDREHTMLRDLFNLLQNKSKVPPGFFNRYYTDEELKQVKESIFACGY
jgi:hypothetical protein